MKGYIFRCTTLLFECSVTPNVRVTPSDNLRALHKLRHSPVILQLFGGCPSISRGHFQAYPNQSTTVSSVFSLRSAILQNPFQESFCLSFSRKIRCHMKQLIIHSIWEMIHSIWERNYQDTWSHICGIQGLFKCMDKLWWRYKVRYKDIPKTFIGLFM
jgi:hypothetical protein